MVDKGCDLQKTNLLVVVLLVEGFATVIVEEETPTVDVRIVGAASVVVDGGFDGTVCNVVVVAFRVEVVIVGTEVDEEGSGDEGVSKGTEVEASVVCL